MNLYQKVAGFADHAVGSTDEYISRVNNDPDASAEFAKGDLGSKVDGGLDLALGKSDEWFAKTGPGGVVDYAKDLVGSGHADDTIDVAGPDLWGTEGSIFDIAVSENGEPATPAEAKTKLLVGGVVGLVILYVLGTLIEVSL